MYKYAYILSAIKGTESIQQFMEKWINDNKTATTSHK